MQTNPLYVIIVTYNGMSWIDRCVESVLKSTIEALPVVVDNDSTDGTVEYIRDKFPQCKLFETKQNLGFGKANNLGIQWAVDHGAEYVYLLNQDAWVEPDTFEILIRCHRESQGFIILSPIHLSADGLTVDKGFFENALGQGRCPNLYNDYLCDKLKDIYPTRFVMAAHWLLYVPYLRKVGLFSPIFPHYGEDSNFVHRAFCFNYSVGICPKAKAFHDRKYRKTPPQKQIYKEEINLLVVLNNPLLDRSKRLYRYLRYVNRIVRIHGVSFICKLHSIVRGLHFFCLSRRYRAMYISDNCYNQFCPQYDKNTK